jgi:hypothetical protein
MTSFIPGILSSGEVLTNNLVLASNHIEIRAGRHERCSLPSLHRMQSHDVHRGCQVAAETGWIGRSRKLLPSI